MPGGLLRLTASGAGDAATVSAAFLYPETFNWGSLQHLWLTLLMPCSFARKPGAACACRS